MNIKSFQVTAVLLVGAVLGYFAAMAGMNPVRSVGATAQADGEQHSTAQYTDGVGAARGSCCPVAGISRPDAFEQASLLQQPRTGAQAGAADSGLHDIKAGKKLRAAFPLPGGDANKAKE